MESCCSNNQPKEQPSCCCSATTAPSSQPVAMPETLVTGELNTPAGNIPLVRTNLVPLDYLGMAKVRLGLGRDAYALPPGLYGAGHPRQDSPVFVSANYKLSFDHLRQALRGIDCWILVLDTKGVNVWCAAGKGTFGTDELVARIAKTKLAEVVMHRELILPQLGASGVAAHEVLARSGFHVIYGPVRANDLKKFLMDGKIASRSMRKVRFNLLDRAIIIPVELMQGAKYFTAVLAVMVLSAGLYAGGFSGHLLLHAGWRVASMVLLSYLSGGIVTPLLLPWIPGRAFSFKGALVGLVAVFLAAMLGLIPVAGGAQVLEMLAWLLLVPALSAFIAMNFTGASTFTSLSGVVKEMRLAVPFEIAAGATGAVLWLVARFI